MTEMQFGYLIGVVAMCVALVFGIWWWGHDAGTGMVLTAGISLGCGVACAGAFTHWQQRRARRQRSCR